MMMSTQHSGDFQESGHSLKSHFDFVQNDGDDLPPGYMYNDEAIAVNWTLAQAAAWAVHRTDAWARRFAPEYLREKPAQALRPVSLSEARNIMLKERFRGVPSRPEGVNEQFDFMAQIDALHKTLESGSLVATGLPAAGGTRIAIRADFWIEADLAGNNDRPHDSIGHFIDGDSQTAFDKVRVNRNDVVRQWPVINAAKPEEVSIFAIAVLPAPTREKDDVAVDKSTVPNAVGGNAPDGSEFRIGFISDPKVIEEYLHQHFADRPKDEPLPRADKTHKDLQERTGMLFDREQVRAGVKRLGYAKPGRGRPPKKD